MRSKTIIFEGGPLDNQFRVLPSDEIEVFEYASIIPGKKPLDVSKIPSSKEEVVYEKKQYVGTNRYYNGIQVFIPKEDNNGI